MPNQNPCECQQEAVAALSFSALLVHSPCCPDSVVGRDSLLSSTQRMDSCRTSGAFLRRKLVSVVEFPVSDVKIPLNLTKSLWKSFGVCVCNVLLFPLQCVLLIVPVCVYGYLCPFFLRAVWGWSTLFTSTVWASLWRASWRTSSRALCLQQEAPRWDVTQPNSNSLNASTSDPHRLWGGGGTSTTEGRSGLIRSLRSGQKRGCVRAEASLHTSCIHNEQFS